MKTMKLDKEENKLKMQNIREIGQCKADWTAIMKAVKSKVNRKHCETSVNIWKYKEKSKRLKLFRNAYGKSRNVHGRT